MQLVNKISAGLGVLFLTFLKESFMCYNSDSKVKACSLGWVVKEDFSGVVEFQQS